MKKKCLVLLLVLGMVLSPIRLYAVDGMLPNIERFTRVENAQNVSEEKDVPAEQLEMSESQLLSNVTEEEVLQLEKYENVMEDVPVEPLKETKSVVAKVPEAIEKVAAEAPKAVEKAAAAVAPIAEASEIADTIYAKYVPDYSAAQIVENGTYVIMGGRNDGNSNMTSAVARSTNVAFTNYTDLVYTTNVNIVNDVISREYADSEWEVVYDTQSGTYSFKAPGEEKYLAIYNANAEQGAVSATTKQNLVVQRNTNVSGSVSIGGPSISNGSTGYLNHRSNPGTWTGTDIGSAWILYRQKFVISDSVLAAVIAEVEDEGHYTSDSWADYETALDAAKEIFGTTDEALEAYESLEAAVGLLEKINLPEGITTTTKDEHYAFVNQANGSTAVEPGIYMLVNSRFYKAMLGEDTEGSISSNGSSYGDLLEKIKVGKTASGQDYGGDYQNNNYESQRPTEIYVEKIWKNASIDWEISAAGNGTYYLKNVENQQYLSMPQNGRGVTQETPVATTITGRNTHSGETYNGSVTVQQGNLYLNLFGGTNGYFGGYNSGNDGGNAVYLYKKVPKTMTYDVEVSKLQTLVESYQAENLQQAEYFSATWSDYAQALTTAESYLAQSHAFESLELAEADQASLNDVYQTLVTAKAELAKIQYRMEELYAAICEANGGEFLYSEECYTSEAGLRYRAALIEARKTFDTAEQSKAAMAELIASVKHLQEGTIADSCFPEITWTITAPGNQIDGFPFINGNGVYNPNGGGVTFDRYEALTWEWEQIADLVNDDSMVPLEWEQMSNGMYAVRYDDDHPNDSNIADVYKISGTFEWPKGYDLSKTTIVLDSENDFFYRDIYEYISAEGLSDYFPLGQVLPVNDDIYVVLWAEAGNTENALAVEDVNEHLAFWTGTSGKGIWTNPETRTGDWNREEPATFLEWNLQGERAFYQSYPNKVGTGALKEDGSAYGREDVVLFSDSLGQYLTQTDQWYTMADTTAVNSVMRSNYTDEQIQPGTIVHVDLYLMNNWEYGMLDQLEIELFKEKETETTVTVNYYLDEVTEDGFLGAEMLTNQEYGKQITLYAGTGAGQLNSYKAEAIYQAGYKDVTDGVQLNNPLTVTEGGENVINVLYTTKAAHTVYLQAPSAVVPFNGNEQTLNDLVIVTEEGVEAQPITEGANAGQNAYLLPDGNIIYGVFASASGTNPGDYQNAFADPVRIENLSGENVIGSYTIVRIPGTLTITPYEPDVAVRTYDFGEKNTYELGSVLNNLEAKAVDVTLAEAKNATMENGNLSFEPASVGESETVNLVLKFNDDYSVTKQVKIVPASNVLYGDHYMDRADDTVWGVEGDAVKYTVDDNERTVYGYTEDIQDTAFSNGGVLKATLDVNGNSGITGITAKTDTLTFTFTGTGFDLLSGCGPDTGMVVAKVTDETGATVASYLVDTYFVGDMDNNPIINQADAFTYQTPVIRKLDLPYGTYTVTVYGYLLNTSGALRTFGMEEEAIPTEDLVMTALEDLEIYDVDVADVEVSFMSEDSVLNGGSGNLYAEAGFGGFALAREGEEQAEAPAGKDSVATVYVDGFRVYQPLTEEQETEAYDTREQKVSYHSVYDFLKTSINDLASVTDHVMVYMEYDGNTGTTSIADYKVQGPQNEVYLTGGNAVAFAVNGYEVGDVIQVGAKLVTPGAKLSSDDGVAEAALYATEMYYDVTVRESAGMNYVVIKNTGEANTVLSLSGLKVSENIGIYASAEIGEQIIKAPVQEGENGTVTEMQVTTAETVLPDRFFTVRVETSTDVKGVRLDIPGGASVNLTAENLQAVEAGAMDVYRFSHVLRVNADFIEDGTYTITVTAYDKNGTALTTQPVVVNVQDSATVQ